MKDYCSSAVTLNVLQTFVNLLQVSFELACSQAHVEAQACRARRARRESRARRARLQPPSIRIALLFLARTRDSKVNLLERLDLSGLCQLISFLVYLYN